MDVSFHALGITHSESRTQHDYRATTFFEQAVRDGPEVKTIAEARLHTEYEQIVLAVMDLMQHGVVDPTACEKTRAQLHAITFGQ